MPVAAMGITNVRDYGARGDGHHDDAAAIQTAIDKGSGTIHFPPGTYRIAKGLVARLGERGKLQIRGATARILNHSPDPAIHLIGTHKGTADPGSVTDLTWDKESSPLVTDIEILGNRRSGDGLRIQGIMQPIISRVTIRDCLHAIHLVRRNRNVVVADCQLYNNLGVGLFLDEVDLHQINVTGSHISYNRQGGIKVLKGNVRNLQIVGNDIEYNYDHDDRTKLAADVWIAAGPIGIREGTICGNTIQAAPTAGGANIRIEGLQRDRNNKAGLLAITGNLISSQDTNVLIQRARGIVVQGNSIFRGETSTFTLRHCAQVLLDSNVVDYNPDYGPTPAGPILLDRCTDCTLRGISVENVGGGSPTAGASIAVRDCQGIQITGCRLTDPVHCGIELRNVADSRISDCIILERRAEPTMQAAVRLAGTKTRGNMIVHNRLGIGRKGPLLGTSPDSRIDGNLMR